ncbi:hypothetical protein F5Y18DRAFT_374742 [Xylariaceae sp. FL1019]|nr:hypothetical protein F5Y18DRAFT_374742 [Xylariaceae sp. FL1019]
MVEPNYVNMTISAIESPSVRKEVKLSNRSSRITRPSIDINIAQNYRDREDLPVVEQSYVQNLSLADEASEAADTTGTFAKLSAIHERGETATEATEKHEGGGIRCSVTGRILAKHHTACVRCVEKGLRCTLNYAGQEQQPTCGACRRSKVQFCVRYEGLKIPHFGPIWKDPNFIFGCNDKGVQSSVEEAEEILREHFEGRPQYVMGSYITTLDAQSMALPSFRRSHDWENVSWQDVLPVWQNMSINAQEKDVRSTTKENESSISNGAGQMSDGDLKAVTSGEDSEKVTEGSLLRISRRYSPREQHLTDEWDPFEEIFRLSAV